MADAPVASPCIGACCIEPADGFCIGCGRTREEIAYWLGYSDDMRRVIKATARARLDDARQRQLEAARAS